MSENSGAPAGPGAGRTLTFAIDTAGWPRVGTTVGIALAGAAIAVSALFCRDSGDLDISIFVVGAAVSVVLLALSGWAQLIAPTSDRVADLVSWPGTAGALGAGAMLAVAVDAGNVGVYAGGAVTLVLSVAGYLLSRAAPFVVSALGATAVLYVQVFDDILGTDEYGMYYGDGGGQFMTIGGAATGFVVVVTVAGWFLPATRVLTGVLAGLGGLFTLAGVMQVLLISRALQSSGDDFSEEFDEEFGGDPLGEGYSPEFGEYYGDEFDDPEFEFSDEPDMIGGFSDFMDGNTYRDDIYVILAFCALLAAFWVACLLVTGHTGFRLLLLADAVAMIPLGLFALAADGVTWWAVAFALVGLALLGVTAYRTRRTPTAPAKPAPGSPLPE